MDHCLILIFSTKIFQNFVELVTRLVMVLCHVDLLNLQTPLIKLRQILTPWIGVAHLLVRSGGQNEI